MIAAAIVNTSEVTAIRNAPLRMVCAVIMRVHAMWVCGGFLIYAQIDCFVFFMLLVDRVHSYSSTIYRV
jgi:hypothetical protein